MREILFAYEPFIRLAAFGGIFILMAVWEFVTPRRKQGIGRGWRWPNNLGIVAVDAVLVRVVFPTTAVGLAILAEARAFGLFNMIALPTWIAVVSSVVILDLAISSTCSFMLSRRYGACTACTTPISKST